VELNVLGDTRVVLLHKVGAYQVLGSKMVQRSDRAAAKKQKKYVVKENLKT
jgi:hypothetical protein